MTKEARTRVPRRRRVNRRGEISRDSAGEVLMIEFNAYARNPLAPKLFVNDVGGIYRIHPRIWQVTFIQKYDGPTGGHEAIEQASLIWPEAEWHATHDLFRWAMGEIAKGAIANGTPRHLRGH